MATIVEDLNPTSNGSGKFVIILEVLIPDLNAERFIPNVKLLSSSNCTFRA